MHEIFNLILKQNLTPNQAYLLYCIQEKESPELINVNLELRSLTPEWVTSNMQLTGKSVYFLKMLLDLNKPGVKKTKPKVDDLPGDINENFVENVSAYRLIFPSGNLPNGSASRSSVKELTQKFAKFFNVFPQYNWEQVLEATTNYVNKYATKEYLYMRTSSNFIMKEENGKPPVYELATQIEMLGETDTVSYQYYTDAPRN